MQDSNAGGICKGPWAAYRAVEDHEALVEVVVLQRGVAVQLGQRVLASDGAGRGGLGGGEEKVTVCTTCPFTRFFG